MLKQQPWLRAVLLGLIAIALLGVGGLAGYQLGLRAAIERTAGQFALPEGFTPPQFGEGGREGFQPPSGGFQGFRNGGGIGDPADTGGIFGSSLLPWLIGGIVLIALLILVLVLALRPTKTQAQTGPSDVDQSSQ